MYSLTNSESLVSKRRCVKQTQICLIILKTGGSSYDNNVAFQKYPGLFPPHFQILATV